MARKVDDGFRGEQSAKAAKKRSKDFDFPEKQFGAGNKKSGKPTVKPKKGTGRTTMKTKGKGPTKLLQKQNGVDLVLLPISQVRKKLR